MAIGLGAKSMFIKLTTMAGLHGYYAVDAIAFFFDHDVTGTLIKMKGDLGAEAVKETADEIAALIAAAKVA
jgi:hypothetical protein